MWHLILLTNYIVRVLLLITLSTEIKGAESLCVDVCIYVSTLLSVYSPYCTDTVTEYLSLSDLNVKKICLWTALNSKFERTKCYPKLIILPSFSLQVDIQNIINLETFMPTNTF